MTHSLDQLKNYVVRAVEVDTDREAELLAYNVTAPRHELRQHFYGYFRIFYGFHSPQITFEELDDNQAIEYVERYMAEQNLVDQYTRSMQ